MGRTTLQAGPFRACIDPSTDLVYLNYVVPVWALGTVEETWDQLSQLQSYFHHQSRRLRFEFVDGIWPDLRARLEQFGLEQQHVLPLMACTPETFRPVDARGVKTYLIDATQPESHRLFYRIQRRGFSIEGDAPEEELAQLRSQLENGFWICAVAELEGEPVSIGTLIPCGGVCELAGVATLPEARRRGVAASLSAYLVGQHFSNGGDLVWLSAATEEARAVYRKIGFEDVGLQWSYWEPG
jgi:ribosomal protein S18 acetylase RimI-like enzyme